MPTVKAKKATTEKAPKAKKAAKVVDGDAEAAPKKTKRKAKYMVLYSPFLMKDTKHELIGEPTETENGRMQWAKCAVSRHMQMINLDTLASNTDKKVTEIMLSREDSKEYSPRNVYKVGDVIYHKTWDDVGIVRAKEVMSNGRGSVLVHFEKNKEKRLIENFK
ncbi:MAG: hypothetical protein ACK5BQ_02620 [Ignavibacteria bacterium]|jgi:hypothetical protein